MKRQKVYESESAILKAIDEAHRRMEDLEVEARTMEQAGMPTEAKRLRHSIYRLETVRLPKLKNLLAAFRTETFQFMGEYRGVVMQ